MPQRAEPSEVSLLRCRSKRTMSRAASSVFPGRRRKKKAGAKKSELVLVDVISSSGAFLLPLLALRCRLCRQRRQPAQPPALSTLPVEPPPTLPLDPPSTPPMTPREPGGGDSGLMSEANIAKRWE